MSRWRRRVRPSSKAKRLLAGSRDQRTSRFTTILETLILRTPGAVAAALVDAEGETVDYAGRLDPFELKVAAAHWQIAMREIRHAGAMGREATNVVVRARLRSFLVRPIHEAYTLLMVMHPRAAFSVSERVLEEAQRDLCAEAGFAPPTVRRWYAVDVVTSDGDPRRPELMLIGTLWEPVEVIGVVVGLPARDRGFRVRLSQGVELLLVRERTGAWWSDEAIERVIDA